MIEKRYTKCDTKIRDNGEEMTQAEVRDKLNEQYEQLQTLKKEKEFYKNIVEEISYSLIDYNRLQVNKELNEDIDSVNSLDEFKELINKGKEDFKKEYPWLKQL